MNWWMVSAVASLAIAVVYAILFATMARALFTNNQWRTNPALGATAALFLGCSIGHAVHFEHSLSLFRFLNAGKADALAVAGQAMFADPRHIVWSTVTAFVALWYLTIRKRLALLHQGAELCADLEKRQDQARDMHDNVVQGLAQAKLALDVGDRELGLATVGKTLEDAKKIISKLLGPEQGLAGAKLKRKEDPQ